MKRARTGYLVAGGLMVLLLLLVALFADRIAPVSPYYTEAKRSIFQGIPPYRPMEESKNLLQARHVLGSDQYGRDVWTRLVFGTRWSLLFAALIMAARMALALPAAFLAVFGPRFMDWAVAKFYVFTSAIPPLLIYVMLLSSAGLRTAGLWPLTAVTVALLALIEWPRIAITVKGRLEHLLTEPYVEGAVAAGATPWRIFRKHLMPHLWPTLLQLLSAEMSRALVVIAQLGIFGIVVGGGITSIIGDRTYIVTTGIPEWGGLLSDGRIFIRTAPWIAFSPATAFLVAVVGFNLLSQGLEGTHYSPASWKERIKERLTPRVWYATIVTLGLLVLAGGFLVTRSELAQARSGISMLKGYNVDIRTQFDINDPNSSAVLWRWQVQKLWTIADSVGEEVAKLFPPAETKPAIQLYKTSREFEQATGSKGISVYQGDGVIRVSPGFFNGLVKWEQQQLVGHQLIRYATDVQLHQPYLDPLILGRFERYVDPKPSYRVDIYGLAGNRLTDLAELYAIPVADQPKQPLGLYAAEAASLDEMIQQRFPGAAAAVGKTHTLEELAQALALSTSDLSGQYLTYLNQKVLEEQIATNPAVRARLPQPLLEAYDVWLREATVPGYQADLLDIRVNGATAKAYLGERILESGAIKTVAISVQDWVLENGVWKRASGTVLRP